MTGDPAGRMGWAGIAKEAARGLTAVRGRSALALVGIVVGIGSVIAMVSTGEIVRAECSTARPVRRCLEANDLDR